jgi:hypothetical protein
MGAALVNDTTSVWHSSARRGGRTQTLCLTLCCARCGRFVVVVIALADDVSPELSLAPHQQTSQRILIEWWGRYTSYFDLRSSRAVDDGKG